MKVLAIIPARGGSKGLPGKNIRPLCGKPLIGWSIEQAKASKYITDKVKEVYQIENVTVIDKAEMDNNPYNVNMPKTAAIFAFGFLIFSVVFDESV